MSVCARARQRERESARERERDKERKTERESEDTLTYERVRCVYHILPPKPANMLKDKHTETLVNTH